RAMLFPWAFLLLMIPVPNILFNQITFPLQLLASKVASTVLPGLGVPVFREGNVIQLPAMALEVAEACRYPITLILSHLGDYLWISAGTPNRRTRGACFMCDSNCSDGKQHTDCRDGPAGPVLGPRE